MLYQANISCKGACPKWEMLAFYTVCTAHPVLVSITSRAGFDTCM